MCKSLYLSITLPTSMSLHCKHILITLFLLVAAVVCSAATSHTKVQKLQIPVLLVEFSDVKFSVSDPIEEFKTLFNGKEYTKNGSQGSVKEYFNANFQGIRTFDFPVVAKVTLNSPISTYGAPSSTFNDTDVKKLLEDACNAAMEDGADFTLYDLDNNGTIENIAIIFAGYSESEGGDPNSIWAHRQNLAKEDFLIGDLKILSYTCNAELKGNSGTTITPIGTVCHEICHFLGLPDMYDTNGETEGLSPALYGTLSIMDKGNHSNNGNTPPLLNSIEKEILGIGEVEDLVPDNSYTLEPVNLSGKIYRIKGSAEGEYFLLECRLAQGWDKFIGGEGLVIYHVDKSGGVHGGIPCWQRWEYNNINCYAEHPCAIVLAAGMPDGNNGALFFPGSSNVSALSYEGDGASLTDWNGNPVGIALEQIKFSNGKVSFKCVQDYLYNNALAKAIECRSHAYQHDAKIEWKNLSAEGNANGNGKWQIKWEQKGANIKGFAVTDTTVCYVNGLSSGAQYDFEVRAIDGMQLGAKASFKLKTHPVTSAFPYIHIGKMEYRKGDTIDLRLFNLQEPPNTIIWSINGQKVTGTSFVFENSGETEIQATIKYNDGSEENIYKMLYIE